MIGESVSATGSHRSDSNGQYCKLRLTMHAHSMYKPCGGMIAPLASCLLMHGCASMLP